MSKTSWGVLHLMTVPKICHKLSPYAKRKAFKIDINHFDIPVKEQVSEEISTSCFGTLVIRDDWPLQRLL